MRYLLLVILFFAQSVLPGEQPAYGQTSPFLFHHLGNLNDNGINFVNDILFDSQKRVWLGGQTGFYRYDGQHYIAYRKTKDSSSIPDNFVHALCQDKQGNIWGGTEAGIFRFNPATRQFKRYLTPDANADQGVNNICCDPNGGLWAATSYQLLYYNPRTDSFEVRLDVSAAVTGKGANDIRKRGMLPSPDGKYLWLATRQGLWAYQIAGGSLLNHATQPQNPFFTNANTSALATGLSGLFLYFDNTQKDIVQFDPAKMTIVKRISLAQTMPEAAGATLFEAKDGGIWLCSWSNQVLMVDPKQNNRIYDLNGKLNESLGLFSNYFWQARQDDDGSIWLATPEGVFVCNEPKNLFKIHRLNTLIPELNPQVFIDVFAENPTDQTWWMTTSANKGIHFITPSKRGDTRKEITSPRMIIHYDPRSGGYETLDLSSAPTNRFGLRPSGTNSICFFENNPVFLTNNGAWIWHTTTKQWQTWETATGIQFPFNISGMAGDAKQGYYITGYQQLAYYNHSQKTVRNIAVYGSNSTVNKVLMLFPRQQFKPSMYGSMGLTGLVRLQTDSAFFIPLVQNIRIDNIGYIDDIDVDSRGQVWVSLKNVGLFRYNPSDGKIRQWDESDGLAVNGIHNLTIDRRDNIWTIHRRQFSVLLAGTDRFFNVAMPIANPILNWPNNLVTLKNGHIVANNFNDIVEFFPDRLLQKPVPRLPEISSLYVNEEPRIFIPGKALRLSPDENSLHFRFGMLTNKVFFSYELQYKLEGAGENWQTSGMGAEAFYNKLPPGRYAFKVRAVATNASWASGEQVIDLVIEKPVHQQFWFILIVVLLILGLLLAISRYRLLKQRQVFQLETKTAELEREKATIQYDNLKQQLNPHFLFNSLTSLAGLIEADQQMAGDFLQRMSDMYRYILKSGDLETVSLGDEIRFVKHYIDIQQTRFGDGLIVDIDVPESCLSFRIAPVTLQNMIENSIKHNIVDQGSPLIIRIFVENDYLVVANNLQKKTMVETSNKTGLTQFKSLYKFLSEKPVLIEENEQVFTVRIPLI
jgi:ligand-binding sensor domain-containing protein